MFKWLEDILNSFMSWLDSFSEPNKAETSQERVASSADLSPDERESHPLLGIVNDKDRWNDLMTDRSIRDADTPLDQEIARLGYFEKLFPDLPNRNAEDGTLLTPVSPDYRKAVVADLNPKNLEQLNAAERQKLDDRIDLHVERAQAAHMANKARGEVQPETQMSMSPGEQTEFEEMKAGMMQRAGRTPVGEQEKDRGGIDL